MKLSNALPWNWSIWPSRKITEVKEEAKDTVKEVTTDTFGHGHDMNPLSLAALQTLRFGSLIGLPILGAFLAEFYVLAPLRGLSDRTYRLALVGAGALAGTAIFVLLGRVIHSAEVVEFKNPTTGEWEATPAPRNMIERLLAKQKEVRFELDKANRMVTSMTGVEAEVIKLLSADPEKHNDLLAIAREIAEERATPAIAQQKLNKLAKELGIDPSSKQDVVDVAIRFKQNALDAQESAEEFERQLKLAKAGKLPEGMRYDAKNNAIIVTQGDHEESLNVDTMVRASELAREMKAKNTPEIEARHEGGGWYNVVVNGEVATESKVRKDEAESAVGEMHMRLKNGAINPADPGFEEHAKEIVLAALQSKKAVLA